MKKVICILTFLISVSCFADCEKSYEVYNVKKNEHGKILSTAGLASPAAGLLSYLFAVRFDIPMTSAAVLGNGGLVLTTIAPAITLAGGISYIQALSYLWGNKIIRQSKVGMGKDLEEWSESLSDKFDREVTAFEVASVVNTANTDSIFCAKDQKPFSKSNFKDYVIKELQ
ncbi:MAG: hypothetical protein HOJ35_11845 [Bdellovibrionales bacterium]|nr:hypothetical protein [Bdellovibrionales bacterium]